MTDESRSKCVGTFNEIKTRNGVSIELLGRLRVEDYRV